MFQKLAALALITAALYISGQIGANASDVQGAQAKLREIDTNGDRSLQFTEIAAARGKIFDRMDANGNGLLDAEEADTVRKAAKAQRTSMPGGGLFDPATISERIRLIDTSGDGVISRAEFVAFLPAELKAADANGDGALSIRELRALKRNVAANTQ